MSVEITPSPGTAPDVARELLAIAEAHPDYTINHVVTTTSAAMGFAFIVPEAIHEAWLAARTEATADEAPVPVRRGRRPANAAKEESS